MVQCHFCEQDACDENHITRFCFSSKYCFKTTALESHGHEELVVHNRGCEDSGLSCDLLKVTKHKNLSARVQMECCSTDNCNNGTFPQLALPEDTVVDLHNTNLSQILIITFGVLLFLSLSVLFIIFIKKRSRKKTVNDTSRSYLENANHVEKEYLNSDYKAEVKVTAAGDSTLREILSIDESVTSGSGSGYPLLVQRTLAKQIDLINCIGQGRYGEVWKGNLHYDEVAVKIFYSRDEASWQREVEIYSTIILKNENILPFIGSDVTSVSSCTQLWLVTTYYPLGSLFDYLNMHTLDMEEMFSTMISIVSGISHLHNEVFGTQGKPAIAHRDIKTKNILMKTNRTCCIADFGLAVTHKQTGSLNIAFNYRVGTKRYMAPEVLDGTLEENDFQSYTMADIYSLSLVLWEMIRRTECKSHAAFSYNVPYQDMVPSDPSFDDMRHVVCVDNRRPEIYKEIEDNPILAAVTSIIKETWSRSPKSRLSALRIKKTLIKIECMMYGDDKI